MKLRLLVYCAFFCVFSTPGVTQIIRLNNMCNPLVGSLSQIAFVVRQDYALKGTDGVMYGQNDQAYFGYRYGAGIVWNNQLYFSPLTYFAHKLDSSAMGYGSEYVPTPTNTYFKKTDASRFENIQSDLIKVTPEKALVPMPDSLSGMQPGSVEVGVTRKTILIVFECRDEVLTDTSKYDLNFLYNTIIREPSGVRLKENNWGNHARFALVFEEITEIGSARLEFKGFAERVGENIVLNLVKVEDAPPVKEKAKPKRK